MIDYVDFGGGIFAAHGMPGDNRFLIYPVGKLSEVASSTGDRHRVIRHVFGPDTMEACKAWIAREVAISQEEKEQ
jgi:hypothetical protein